MTEGPYERYKAKEREREKQEREREKQLLENAPLRPWHLGIREPVARFTAVLAVFTFCLIAVGALQWCTLHNTDASMHKQVKDARATSRAFLYVASVDPRFAVNSNKVGAYQPTVTVANSGSVVPEKVILRIYCQPKRGAFVLPRPDPQAVRGFTLVVGPHASQAINTCSQSLESIVKSMYQEHMSWYVYGDITYTDGFGKPRYTRFCTHARFFGERKPQDLAYVPCSRPNAYLNCVDNGCSDIPPAPAIRHGGP